MKTFIIIITTLISNLIQSQVITGLSVTQNNTNQIKTNLKVQLPNWGEYSDHNIIINQNIITISVCYYMSGATAIVNLENDFLINIPNNNTYTLITNIYLLGTTSCNYDQLEDTATLTFSTPIQGTISLTTDESQNNNQDLILFPTPAIDELNIKTTEKIQTISLYDASGKKLPAKLENNKLYTAQLIEGTYFLKISTDKKTFHKKFTVKK